MATPEQVLQQVRQAKGQVKQAAVSPNTQGTRGTPGRGGVAARPVPKKTGPPGGDYMRADGGTAANGWTSQTGGGTRFPGFKPKPQDGGVSAGSTGLRSLSGREPNMTPDKPTVEPADLQAKIAGLPPQIQQAIKNRGLETVMANRAGLAGRLGMLGAPAAPGPGARPLPPGAEPGVGAAVSGGLTPEQRAGAKPMPMPTAPYPGFRPRGGVAPGASGGLTARPMPGAIPADGPAPAAPGLGQTISDPADQMGGGFGDVARTASGLMARRRLVGSMDPGQMER